MQSDQDSHPRAGASYSGTAGPSPQPTSLPLVDASLQYSDDGMQSGPAGENKQTRLLRAIVRSTAIILVMSITADIYKNTLFAWHPIFMALGFLGFMSEGVQLAHAFRSLEGADRVNAIWRHAAMQLAACSSIAIGFGAIYINKIRLGKLHYQSWHGFIGVVLTVAALTVMLFGGVVFRRLGVLQKLPWSVQPILKRAHTTAGAVVWLAGLSNVLLGLRTHGAGPRVTLHYGQAIVMSLMAVAQGALLLQPRPAPRAEQQDAARTYPNEALLELQEKKPLRIWAE